MGVFERCHVPHCRVVKVRTTRHLGTRHPFRPFGFNSDPSFQLPNARTNSGWVALFLVVLGATRELMGDNYWPYGIAPNRKALETLFRYSHEQGLSSRELTIEELFHPATLQLSE